MITDYINQLFVKDNGVRDNIYTALSQFGVSANCVRPEAGKFLYLLVKLTECKQVLEIGTSGGYSTMWLAKGIAPLGQVTTLEINPTLANFARKNLENEGLKKLVTFVIGDALHSLKETKEKGQCFDLVFIDADKANYTNYLENALEVTHSGSLIVTDNVLWGNRIFDQEIQDENTKVIRSFNQYVAGHRSLESILLPLGDGLLVSRVI